MTATAPNYFWQKPIQENIIRVGLTTQAQEELGKVRFVELPLENDNLVKGDTLLAVEAEKAVLDLESPVTGQVRAVHQQVENDPELMNSSDPEYNWIAEIAIDA